MGVSPRPILRDLLGRPEDAEPPQYQRPFSSTTSGGSPQSSSATAAARRSRVQQVHHGGRRPAPRMGSPPPLENLRGAGGGATAQSPRLLRGPASSWSPPSSSQPHLQPQAPPQQRHGDVNGREDRGVVEPRALTFQPPPHSSSFVEEDLEQWWPPQAADRPDAPGKEAVEHLRRCASERHVDLLRPATGSSRPKRYQMELTIHQIRNPSYRNAARSATSLACHTKRHFNSPGSKAPGTGLVSGKKMF